MKKAFLVLLSVVFIFLNATAFCEVRHSNDDGELVFTTYGNASALLKVKNDGNAVLIAIDPSGNFYSWEFEKLDVVHFAQIYFTYEIGENLYIRFFAKNEPIHIDRSKYEDIIYADYAIFVKEGDKYYQVGISDTFNNSVFTVKYDNPVELEYIRAITG